MHPTWTELGVPHNMWTNIQSSQQDNCNIYLVKCTTTGRRYLAAAWKINGKSPISFMPSFAHLCLLFIIYGAAQRKFYNDPPPFNKWYSMHERKNGNYCGHLLHVKGPVGKQFTLQKLSCCLQDSRNGIVWISLPINKELLSLHIFNIKFKDKGLEMLPEDIFEQWGF